MYQDKPYVKRHQIDPQKKKKWDQQQIYIRSQIIEHDCQGFNPKQVKLVAGVDISFSSKFDNGACSGLLIYDVDKRKIVYEDYQYVTLKEQYIPGFLAFRELAPTLQLFKRLKADKPQLWPEVIMVDGNGIVHKKKCGYACHLGVILKMPSIGCAKTFFDIDGLHASQVQQMLRNNLGYHGQSMRIKGLSGKQWCTAVLGNQDAGKHLYISVGNMISLDSATELAMKMLKHETPQPVRLVDSRSRKMIRKMTKQDYQSAKSYEMPYLKQ